VGQKHIQFINQQKHVSMKKLLFLTALFTSLLISFAACSDSENIIDCTDEPQWFPTYTIIGRLTYNSDSTGYLLEIAKESDKLVNDTLIPFEGKDKPAERITVLKAKTLDTVTLDGTKISSMTGSIVSIPAGYHSIRKEEGDDDFVLHFSYDISVLSDSRSDDGEYIIDSNPPIYPDAYTTVPLSRATFN
ncbi:MAG: hypothetical protein K2L69_04135, partial [Muribaculaceae bacterium]|nr:hypothetical protein [Muribaculaceae bacterium]